MTTGLWIAIAILCFIVQWQGGRIRSLQSQIDKANGHIDKMIGMLTGIFAHLGLSPKEDE